MCVCECVSDSVCVFLFECACSFHVLNVCRMSVCVCVSARVRARVCMYLYVVYCFIVLEFVSYLKDDWKPISGIAQEPGRRASDWTFPHILQKNSHIVPCAHACLRVC